MNEREWLESELEITRRERTRFSWLASVLQLKERELEAELMKLKRQQKINVIEE